jgi:hypothetical protein
MVPIGTIAIESDTEADAGSAGANGNDTGPTPKSSKPVVQKDECIAQTVEELSQMFAKPDCDAEPEGPWELGSRLKVKLIPSTPVTSPGGRVDVKVTITNESADKIPVFFKLNPTAQFDFEVLDARNKRVDTPSGKAPKAAKDSGNTRVGRVTLLPGGVIKANLAWDALKRKYAKDGIVPAGSLPVGKYTLRVVIPFAGAKDAEGARPTTPIEVSN